MGRPVPVMAILVRRYRLAAELVLLTLVAYLAALGVVAAMRNAADDLPPPVADAAVEPKDAPPAALADYAVIAERDIFNPGGATERPASPTLRLWGVAFRGHEATAVIEDTTTHRQDLYRVGDAVGGAHIASIDWDRVTLARGDGEESLALATPAERGPAPAPETAPVTPSAGQRIRQTGENAFVVDRRELAGAVDGSMSGLLTQLRAVAEVRDGHAAGFRLFQIRDDSLFARLGLKNGDVVQRVNGTPIAEPAALLAFLQKLEREPRVALDIVRADAARTLVYDLR